MKLVFRNCYPNHPNKPLLVLDLRISFLHEVLLLERFEGVGFKYENSFLKVPEMYSETCQTSKIEHPENYLTTFSR